MGDSPNKGRSYKMATKQKTSKAGKAYDGSQIRVISDDVERVREKPSMYIGDLEHGVFTLIREVFDNCVDEYTAGRNNVVKIQVDSKARRVTIWDEGQGIPTEKKTVGDKKISALEAVFVFLHSGGKFDDKAYKTARGTHGVGNSAVNALSAELTVVSAYAKGPLTIQFKRGRKVSEKAGCGSVKSGTWISFIPDETILGKQFVSKKDLVDLCQQTAYLNPKLTIYLAYDDKKFERYREPKGMATLLASRIGKSGTITKPWSQSSGNVSLALAFTDGTGNFTCHTNSLLNDQGGTHQEQLVQTLLTRLKKEMSSRDKPFAQTELLDGLVGVIDVRLSAPKFSSQHKEKLVDPRVKTELGTTITKLIDQWATANKSRLKELVKRLSKLRELRASMLESKKLLGALKNRKGGIDLPEKLTVANCKPAERELYLVEGDSAGGTAKQARFRFQEILPLKGKITNAMKAKEAAVLASEEVLNILKSMGFDPSIKNKDPLDHLRISKVILMSDPDSDGSHINALILTLFLKYMAQAFKRPLIYMVKAAEYTAVWKNRRYFGDTVEELRKQGVPDTVKALHIKGYGEFAASGLREIAMDPKTRRLIQLTAPSADEMKSIQSLMSEDVTYRRKLFENLDHALKAAEGKIKGKKVKNGKKTRQAKA
jgi:DNA gyrase/topoisomerase IV subunit B